MHINLILGSILLKRNRKPASIKDSRKGGRAAKRPALFVGGGRRPPPLWRLSLGLFTKFCSQACHLYASTLWVQILGNQMMVFRCLICALRWVGCNEPSKSWGGQWWSKKTADITARGSRHAAEQRHLLPTLLGTTLSFLEGLFGKLTGSPLYGSVQYVHYISNIYICLYI
jgi:hypothetical protein